MLTEKQEYLIKHSLGLTRSNTPYRNHFSSSVGDNSLSDLEKLVEMGFMRKRISAISPDYLFHVTEKGAEAVGSHLPKN